GALQMFRSLRDEWGAASCMADLGTVARYQGELERARTLYRDALVRFVELRHRRGVARVLELFAVLAAQQGSAETALALGSAAERMRQEMGAISPFIDQHELSNWLQKASDAVDHLQADEARERGGAMSFRDAVEFAVREV
ncbi:MAG TPA: hypothetical protein VFL80_05445, partial [Thermoanaerobaculia bacterium]|nr:hypothetical protein [Thermoanaerobaculia bacterium]